LHCAVMLLCDKCLLLLSTATQCDAPKSKPSICTRTILSSPNISYTPSSIPTFLHHGLSLPLSANISSASPTCLLSLTSLLTCPDNLSFIAFMAKTLVGREPYLLVPCANPWEPDRMSSVDVHPSLMTGNCYCRGSDEEERRFRCR
jgi:hypothetical protein